MLHYPLNCSLSATRVGSVRQKLLLTYDIDTLGGGGCENNSSEHGADDEILVLCC